MIEELNMNLLTQHKYVSIYEVFPKIIKFSPLVFKSLTNKKAENWLRENNAYEKLSKYAYKRTTGRNMIGMIQSWKTNMLVKDRKRIIGEILKAYELKLHSAVVILTISEIENLIKKQIMRNNNMSIGDKISFLDMKKHICKSEPILEIYVDEIFFHDDRNGSDLSSNLSRHSIIHGNDANYGDSINEKSILYLYDYLLKHSLGKFGVNKPLDENHTMEELLENEDDCGNYKDLKFI